MRGESIHSYRRFMWENLFSQIDIDRRGVHILQGEVGREDVDDGVAGSRDAIARAGGIDFQILGIGKTATSGSTGRDQARKAERDSSCSTPRSRAETRPRISSREDFVPREALANRGSRRFSRHARSRSWRRASTKHRSSSERWKARSECRGSATFVQKHPEQYHVLRRPCRRRRAHAQCDAMAARRGGMDAGPHRARGLLAVAESRARDPQADTARLRRAHVVARGALRDAGRRERRGVQHVRREDPRQSKLSRGKRIGCSLAASGQ